MSWHCSDVDMTGETISYAISVPGLKSHPVLALCTILTVHVLSLTQYPHLYSEDNQ